MSNLINKIKGGNGSSGSKILMIGLLILVLMIPTMLVKEVIRERKSTQNQAIYEVSQKWGDSQVLKGPVVTVPYLKWPKASKSDSKNFGYVHFLPDTLNIEGQLLPEVRTRGIFKVPLYTADLKIAGTFNKNASVMPVPEDQILWDQTKISFGITDMRGIREQVRMTMNESEFTLKSGLFNQEIFHSGVGIELPDFVNQDTHTFSMNLMLNGSQMIQFVPMGKETKVNLASSWQNPSFDGSYLPTDHTINEEGFKANWSILDVNRNYPQEWVNQIYQTDDSRFGLKLFMPVDSYQKTTRSVKYAILFIALTFLAFFLAEILNNFRIHPVQYLLVGFAIVLFYLLLLSLSEHIGFGWAYVAASVGIVGMVSLYSGSVLHIKKLAYLIGGLLALLYAFLYFLLQAEEMALLLGSIALFLILGVVMYLTRNIDWYSMKKAD